MKAVGDQICQVTTGFGSKFTFEYYTDTGMFEYADRRDWVRANIGLFGEDYYYNQGRWWFRTEDDLLAFTLRFGRG